MNVSRHRWLFVLAVLAVAVTVSSSAVTTTNTDRGTGVETVEDDRMLLGVVTETPELSNETYENVVVINLRNQFSAGTTLTTIQADVTETDSESGVNVQTDTLSTPSSLEPGESGAITVNIECSTNSTVTEEMTISVSAAGADERFSASRQTTVTCSG